jgi:AcrR family transcriptional regulator
LTREASKGAASQAVVSDVPRDGTATRVVEVAGALFREHGYEGVTMNTIAGAVGISAPALYWHFKSKEDICLAFLMELAGSLLATLDRAAVSEDPVERLRQIVEAHIRHQFSNYDGERSVQNLFNYGQFRLKLSPEKRLDLDKLHAALGQRLRTVIKSGMDSGVFRQGDVVATTYAVMALGEFVPSWFRPDGRLSLDELCAHHAEAALRIVLDKPERAHARRKG